MRKGLWRNNEETKEGKFLVLRRDGTIPEWPWFVMGAKDPCAFEALTAYADSAERQGFDPDYVADIRELAVEFQQYLHMRGAGEPDAPRHREDNEAILRLMRGQPLLVKRQQQLRLANYALSEKEQEALILLCGTSKVVITCYGLRAYHMEGDRRVWDQWTEVQAIVAEEGKADRYFRLLLPSSEWQEKKSFMWDEE